MGFPQIAQEQAEKAVASVGNFEGSLSTDASPVPVVVTCWSRILQLQKKLLVLVEREKFSGKRTGRSYDAVARFQLESRDGNYEFWDKKSQEGDGTRAAERRNINHCIEGSGGRQEGSATLIKEKEQQG